MANLIEQAINCDDSDRAARIIGRAFVSKDELAKYCLRDWPTDHKQRALTIGQWLRAEADFLA